MEFDVRPLVAGAKAAGTSLDDLAARIRAQGLSAQDTTSALVAGAQQASIAFDKAAAVQSVVEKEMVLPRPISETVQSVVPAMQRFHKAMQGSVPTLEDTIVAALRRAAHDTNQDQATAKPTERDTKIYEVILRGAKGRPYCRELHRARLRPRETGKWKDCPGTYPAAYTDDYWRQRINEEKTEVRRKCEAFLRSLGQLKTQ